jgi:hypothetical protein
MQCCGIGSEMHFSVCVNKMFLTLSILKGIQ